MICAVRQIKCFTGLNPQFIQTGFFVAKNVGKIFQNKLNILMVEHGD